jgi:hypothetical protein
MNIKKLLKSFQRTEIMVRPKNAKHHLLLMLLESYPKHVRDIDIAIAVDSVQVKELVKQVNDDIKEITMRNSRGIVSNVINYIEDYGVTFCNCYTLAKNRLRAANELELMYREGQP